MTRFNFPSFGDQVGRQSCCVCYIFLLLLSECRLLLASRVILSEKENIDPNVMMAAPNEKKVSSCRVVSVIEDMRIRAEEMATESEFTMKLPKHVWNLVKKEMDTKHETGWVGLQRDQLE